MAVKTNQYLSRITQDTSRGYSMGIWGDCPIEDFKQNGPGGIGTVGCFVEDDFNLCGQPTLNAASSFGQWACFADTGSTFLDANEEGGVIGLTNGTAAKAILLASNAASFKLVTAATGRALGQKLWFEVRVALGSISGATQGCFIGLADHTSSQITSANNTILATTANTFTGTKGLIGFTVFESAPTDWSFQYQAAGGSTVSPTGLTTLVTTVTGTAPAAYAAVTNGNGTGFVKLGFVFDPSASIPAIPVVTATGDGTVTQTVGTVLKPTLQLFVNGQLCGTFLDSSVIQTSRFPSKRMSPVICFMDASGGGGGAAGIYLDWIRVAQLASF